MDVCWTFAILLCCTLAEAAQPHNTCICNETLQAFRGASRQVRVPCPYVDAGIMTFHLYKDDVGTSTITCQRENQTLNCTPSDNVIMHGTQRPSISFVLTNHSQGIYKCQGSSDYPPPYKNIPSEVHVQVIEFQYKTVANQKQEFPWIWIVAVSVFVIYSVTLTIIALVYWRKLKKVDSQSDYMNTKPRAPRGFKKRGVQNPIPRYF